MSITILYRLLYTYLLIVSLALFSQRGIINQSHVFSLMLDPAGDAKHTGRRLEDSFERGITLQCTEQLKKVLEKRHPNMRVVLTRFPGESLQPLQNANFANRLDVDFYLSIHFFQEKNIKPQLFLYHFSYNDDFITKVFDLCFYRYDQAHLFNMPTIKLWGNTIKNVLEKELYKKQFDVHSVFKLPFKPLIGIKAPAIALEAGLKYKDDWYIYIEPIADSISAIINLWYVK